MLQCNALLSNPHQPIIIQQGQQKSWCDYAFLAATISSIGFLGRYVWLQNKKIKNLEENDQKNSKLLHNIQAISAANSEQFKNLQSCQSNISDKLQKLTSKTCSIESLLGQTRKLNGLNLLANLGIQQQLKKLEQQNQSSFEKLYKTIAESHEASAKNESEILKLLSANAAAEKQNQPFKFSLDGKIYQRGSFFSLLPFQSKD